MATKYNVYGIGNALVDIEFDVTPAFLEKHGITKGVMTLVDEDLQRTLIKQINRKEAVQKPGGSAANTMIALSQLGGSGFYSCKVANDEAGELYINAMNEAGIDTNFIRQQRPAGITGKCLVMVTDDADRTMNTFLGITETLSVDEIEPAAIKNADYVYLEGYLVTSDTGFAALQEVKKQARAAGTKVALTLSDPSIAEAFSERFKTLVGTGVDLLFCNEEEVLIFTGTDSLDDAQQALAKQAGEYVITQGPKGALLYDGSHTISVAGKNTKAIDTNGAGDMFAGAYLYGITNGLSRKKAGQLANRAGAAVVAQYGPRLTEKEMQQLLNDNK